LREWFNAIDFTSEIRAARVHVKRIYDQPVDEAFIGGRGRSIRDQYVDGRDRVLAEVHYYIGPTRTTRPDPKVLFHEGATYFLDED
jgi:hypothetical protein